MDSQTKRRIQTWLKEPFDPSTQAAVRELLKTSPQEAEDAFYADLSFGTAGLRGIMGIGTHRMNVYTIRKTTEGLAHYLISQFPGKSISVAIGFDSRHHSEEFAREAADVLSHYGIKVFLLKQLRPTPYVSFACRHFQANAAIMITASHNPKEYNGYKVYWQDGAQVVPPHDIGIMKAIDAIHGFSGPKAPRKELIREVGEELDLEYLKAISPLQNFPEENKRFGQDLNIVYTSLHGTGITLAPKALNDWGFSSIALVEKQAAPDGDFPSVHFPNPEYPEALQLGIELLKQTNSDLFLATDPDADRLGVVVFHQGQSVTLNGNEIASLCVAYLCQTLQKKNAFPPNPAFITTVVSTDLIETICRSYPVACFKVLTGFKYIGEKIHEWEQTGAFSFLFGAEESYGFLRGTHARDKDAIVTSCLIAEMALHLKKQEKTLVDFLHEIYQTYGIFKEEQISLNFSPGKEGMEAMGRLMKDLRTASPTQLGGKKIETVQDYSPGIHGLPPSDMLSFKLEGGTRILIRPSGTEPKIKVYGGIHVPYRANVSSEIQEAAAKLQSFLKQLKSSLSSS